MNALDLIKYGLSADALIISSVFSIESLGDKDASCCGLNFSYINFSSSLSYFTFYLSFS